MKKNYLVKDRVQHDGDTFEIDSPIELSEKEAQPLLVLGVIAEDETKNTPPKAPEGEERVAAIKAAIDGLDKANTGLFTAGGVPKTEAIAAVTGWPVSAKERDAILAPAA